MKSTLLYCCLSMLILGCKSTKDATNTMEEMKEGDAISLFDDMENTSFEENHEGTYSGLTPCADCMGIQTQLTLKADGKFTSKSKYLGRSEEVHTAEGRYQLDNMGKDLIFRIDNKITSQYHINGNVLVPFGPQNEMSNSLQELYSLYKNNGRLTNRYWQATELIGKKVALPQRDVYLIFRNDSTLGGSGGCNQLSSTFTFNNKEKSIRFGHSAMTKMACAEKDYDSELAIVLDESRYFTFDKKGNLNLLSEKKKTLATFEGSSLK